jgi:hypothetical protein
MSATTSAPAARTRKPRTSRKAVRYDHPQPHPFQVVRAEITDSEDHTWAKPQAFGSVPELDAQLSKARHYGRAHRGGGYTKTWFRLTFRNGDTYEGRIDITESDNHRIGPHIQNFLSYHAGRVIPYRYREEYPTIEAWCEWLDRAWGKGSPELREGYARLLESLTEAGLFS